MKKRLNYDFSMIKMINMIKTILETVPKSV